MEDGRKRWAQLTPQGRKMMQQEIPRAAASIAKAWEWFGQEDKQQLMELLEKLLEGLPQRSNGHGA
jgi:DNA-binding MarR family transcriptional regulator